MKAQKRRQQIRKAIILASFLLFPITLYYLSPSLIIVGAFQGIATGSFVLFALLFLSSLFVGRVYCAWLCPAAGLGETCTLVVNKRASGGKLNWIKYIIWVPWLGVIIWAFMKAGGIRKINPLFQTTSGISVDNPAAYIVYFAVIFLIVILAFFAGRRGFCHYACWMAPFMIIGSYIKNLVKWPSLYLRLQTEKCINCNRCTDICPMSLDVNAMVQNGSMKNAECILCGQCVDICPKGVIHYSLGIPN